VKQIEDADKHYIDFLRQSFEALDLHSLTVALDCANGATYKVAPALMKCLGATIIPTFCNPDGKNINAQCGSQHPEHLARAVVEKNADLGLAFDGDGDRLIAVDEEGHVLSGDQIMAILAQDYLQRGLLKNSRVVATVMSNMGFRAALQQLNIELYTSQVGDRYVMEKMLEKDAILGGEDSGHMIFRDVHTTGDGILAALRLIGALQRSGKPLSQLAKVMTLFPQKLINVDVKAKPDFTKIPEISHAIARAEGLLGEKGRVLVRYSGTQNKCRVMVEGPTEEQTDDLCRQIAATVQRMIG
jgi:phosphoglucosamine mutase